MHSIRTFSITPVVITAAVAIMAATRCIAQTPLSVINLGPTGLAATATAVNDDYQVVGSYTDSSFVQHGFFWQPGLTAQYLTNAKTINAINNLGVLGGQINSSGAYADYWYPTAPYSGAFTAGRAFTTALSSTTGVGDDLAMSGWEGAGPTAYWSVVFPNYGSVQYSYGSNTGEALGIQQGFDALVGYSSASPQQAAWWPYGSGTMQLLTVVTGYSSPSVVTAVDEGFDMVGYATLTKFPNPVRPMIFDWAGGASVPMLLLHNTFTGEALAVNGTVDMIGGYCSTQATVWYPYGGNFSYNYPVGLNSLTGPTSQWHLQTVTGINDYGAFVGAGLFGQKRVAYLAIPVTLSSISFSTNPVVAPSTVQITGTVTISSPAPFDMTVSLSSFLNQATFTSGSHTSSVVIPQGTTSADFPLNVAAVTKTTSAYIRANYGGWDVYSKLVVVP